MTDDVLQKPKAVVEFLGSPVRLAEYAVIADYLISGGCWMIKIAFVGFCPQAGLKKGHLLWSWFASKLQEF